MRADGIRANFNTTLAIFFGRVFNTATISPHCSDVMTSQQGVARLCDVTITRDVVTSGTARLIYVTKRRISTQ